MTPDCAPIFTPSPMVRWPTIPTCPPATTPMPSFVEPAMPTCDTMRQSGPSSTLWAIWTRLSIFGPAPDPRRPERRAVDAGVRADLDVVLDDRRCPICGHLVVARTVPSPSGSNAKPKPSAPITQPGCRMTAVPDDAALAHHDVRVEQAVLADPRPLADEHARDRGWCARRSRRPGRSRRAACTWALGCTAALGWTTASGAISGDRLAGRVEQRRDLARTPGRRCARAARCGPAGTSTSDSTTTAPARVASKARPVLPVREERDVAARRRPRAARPPRRTRDPSPTTSPPTRAASSARVNVTVRLTSSRGRRWASRRASSRRRAAGELRVVLADQLVRQVERGRGEHEARVRCARGPS